MSDCCGPTCCSDDNAADASTSTATVHDKVRDGYAKVAEAGTLTTIALPTGGGCCGSDTGQGGWSQDELAEKLGYGSDELAALPQGANMGLSCGNPTAIAALKPGQVVVDLGSGGGFDCFLAGPKVGDTGRVIGVDMTPPMLTKARANLDHYRTTSGLDNVEFRLGEIEHLPLADASVDVVISNCVINLSPDKPRVWREIARVLKPGGKVAASDMALFKPLPESIAGMVEALVGCVAGAVLVDDYRAMVEAAGVADIVLTPKPDYIAALASLDDPLYAKIAEGLPAGKTVADYVTSLDVQASRV
ncbi:MAG: arsenite methyltransferase [Planctomycetota bacterium]